MTVLLPAIRDYVDYELLRDEWATRIIDARRHEGVRLDRPMPRFDLAYETLVEAPHRERKAARAKLEAARQAALGAA